MRKILLTILFLLFALPVFAQNVLSTSTIEAMIEAAEIAGTTFLPLYTKEGITVQLMSPVSFISVNEIPAVEVYARAWKGADALAFGGDGTTEIERFRIYRPETEIRDNINGDIIQISRNRHGDVMNKYRKNTEEALIQMLVDTIQVAHYPTNSKIIIGKRGNTTSTFRPAVGAADPVDGRVQRGINQNETWTLIHDSTGNGTSVTAAGSQNHIYLADDGTNWDAIYRSVFGFNTSTIGSDTVDSCTFSLFAEGTDGDGHNVSVVTDRNPPAAVDNLSNPDFDIAGWDGVKQSDTTIDLGAWGSGGAQKDFACNATGKTNVNTSGDTWWGTRSSADFDNVEPTKATATSDGLVDYADTVGTTLDPMLVVVHSAVVTASFNDEDYMQWFMSTI